MGGITGGSDGGVRGIQLGGGDAGGTGGSAGGGEGGSDGGIVGGGGGCRRGPQSVQSVPLGQAS